MGGKLTSLASVLKSSKTNQNLKLSELSTDDAYSAANNGGNNYDVVMDYAWTLTPKENRRNIPIMKMYEYEQDINTIYAHLFHWYNQIKEGLKNENPYEGLYHAKPTGAMFSIPYFESYHHAINQKWEDSQGIFSVGLMSKLLDMASFMAQAANIAPGVAVNKPRVWKGVEPASYPVTFKLFNTTDESNDYTSIANNIRLINRLTMSTLHDQQNIMLASPPALFEIVVPGIRVCPAAVIQSIAVTNLGQLNMINGLNVPDAYEVTLNIMELIGESRQILNSVFTSTTRDGVVINSTIKAINDNTIPFVQAIEDAKADFGLTQ